MGLNGSHDQNEAYQYASHNVFIGSRHVIKVYGGSELNSKANRQTQYTANGSGSIDAIHNIGPHYCYSFGLKLSFR